MEFIECECCNGVGEVNETLGGECFSNPHAVCPDCDGVGGFRAATKEESDRADALLGIGRVTIGLPVQALDQLAELGFSEGLIPQAFIRNILLNYLEKENV